MISLKEALEKEYIFDPDFKKKVKINFDKVAKPLDSLGKFEDMLAKIGAIEGKEIPDLDKAVLTVFAADNGIIAEGVSQSDHTVTSACAKNIAAYRSTAGIFAKRAGADIKVIDMGIKDEIDYESTKIINKKVACATRDFVYEPAMTKNEVIKALEIGINLAFDLKNEGYKVICLGEMGIGNTTTSSALCAALLHLNAKEVTGRGAGLSDQGLEKKIMVIDHAINKYDLYDKDPLTTLQYVGGLDIAGMTGMIIGAALSRIPIILDGLISLTAALIAKKICKKNIENFVIGSHVGKERATKLLLSELGIEHIISADLALGEGTGALLCLEMLKTVNMVLDQTIKFNESTIEQYSRFEK